MVIRVLWDNIMYTNIHISEVPKEEEREREEDNIFEEIIAKKFPNLEREIVI